MTRRRPKKNNTRSSRGKRETTSLDEKFVAETGDKNPEDEYLEGPLVEERKSFGNNLSTWMVVEISTDGMFAKLKRMSFGGDTTLTAEDILKALREKYLIVEGIDTSLIQDLTARALAKPDAIITGNHQIACGTPPVSGRDGQIEYTFQDRLSKGTHLDFHELNNTFERTTLEEVLGAGILGLFVQPGEELARRITSTQGEPGRDIFGNVSMSPGRFPSLEIGAPVRESGDRFFATICGYVYLEDQHLSIHPPLWLAPDLMTAYFIHLQQAAPLPALCDEWLFEALTELEVSHGIDKTAISVLCHTPPQADIVEAVLIAQGTPPIPGADTMVDHPFQIGKHAGKILPDGSIDLRDRNSVVGVEEGQLLGKVISATKGIPGKNLIGENIETTDGKEISFKAGENVRGEGDPPHAFFAEINGNIYITSDTIDIKKVFIVDGDVDYEVGNIDTTHDVQINGNISAGFRVKSGGSISVGGLIEAGAVLSCRGDIIAAQGILGEGTQVTAQGVISMGSILTKFIQNSTVMAKGDIEVGSYIFNSKVRSGTTIRVHKEGGVRGGSIVGGETFASQSIHCHIGGSQSTSTTTIGINPDPANSARIAKLDKAIAFCESNIVRLLRTMGLQTIDAARIKAAMHQAPISKKKVMVEIIKKIYELVETRDISANERATLEQQQSLLLDKGEITVEGTLYSGIRIVMGKNSHSLTIDCQDLTFYNSSGVIRSRPPSHQSA